LGENNLGSARTLLSNYKIKAKKRGLVWDLTEEKFLELTKMDCHYCGREPSQKVWSRNPKNRYIYNGIDRVDNTKGYSSDNCVACCGDCNHIKSNKLSYAQMIVLGKVLRFINF